MTTDTTRDLDLARLADAIPAQRWTFAKSMPWIPHEYTLRERWVESTGLAFDDAVLIVRNHGYPEQFGKRIFVYLNVGEWKYWTMGNPIDQTKVLNRARLDRQK